jgi:hypothetical protein
MPRKNKTIKHGLFTIFGLTINLNTIVTTVLGSILCVICGWGLVSVRNIGRTIVRMETEVPRMEEDVRILEKTFKRLAEEYPPLPKSGFNASISSAQPVPSATP